MKNHNWNKEHIKKVEHLLRVNGAKTKPSKLIGFEGSIVKKYAPMSLKFHLNPNCWQYRS